MQAEEYLAVPLLFSIEPVRTEHGWVFETAYPEFPGCTVRSDLLTEAIDRLEERRIDLTLELLAAGDEPPAFRKPLGYLIPIAKDALRRRAAAATDGGER